MYNYTGTWNVWSLLQYVVFCWSNMFPDMEQRIRIEEIRSDEWFQKNYEPIKEIENEEVNLDDVNAAFDDPEV